MKCKPTWGQHDATRKPVALKLDVIQNELAQAFVIREIHKVFEPLEGKALGAFSIIQRRRQINQFRPNIAATYIDLTPQPGTCNK